MRRLAQGPLQMHTGGRLQFRATHAARTVLLATLASATLLALRPWVEAGWQSLLLGWVQLLGLPGDFALQPSDSAFRIGAPRLDLPLAPPDFRVLALYALGAAAAWWAAARVPERGRPAAWLLRAAAALQALGLLMHIAGWPLQWPATPAPHVAALLNVVWWLMLALPWLQVLGRPLLPSVRWRRLGLALLAQAWLAVLAPCLAATHVALLVLMGPLSLPLLALLGGAVPVVLGLLALHASMLARSD